MEHVGDDESGDSIEEDDDEDDARTVVLLEHGCKRAGALEIKASSMLANLTSCSSGGHIGHAHQHFRQELEL